MRRCAPPSLRSGLPTACSVAAAGFNPLSSVREEGGRKPGTGTIRLLFEVTRPRAARQPPEGSGWRR